MNSENRKAELFSTSLLLITALLSIYAYVNIESLQGTYIIYKWIALVDTDLNFSILLDPLTATMFCVVNIVSAVVHMFSIGYMKDDPYRARFFCYL